MAKLDGEPRGEPFFAVGNPAEILADASEELDLLVLGSRGYGPLHSVLVGGVAGRVVREAACPVCAAAQGRTRAGGLAVRRDGAARPRVAV